jgi:hypothetical protein
LCYTIEYVYNRTQSHAQMFSDCKGIYIFSVPLFSFFFCGYLSFHLFYESFIYHFIYSNFSLFIHLLIYSFFSFIMNICYFLFTASSSAQGQGQGQKRQAPDVLSKYSLKHSIEEKVAAALQSEKRFLELDKKLESYQNAGLNNKNKETSNGEEVV